MLIENSTYNDDKATGARCFEIIEYRTLETTITGDP